MRQRMILAFVLVAVLGRGPAPAAAQEASAPDSGWGALPAEASFAPIADGTAADLTTAAALVRVTRYRWEPDSGLGGFCFDLYSGGPEILLVEEGTLRVVVGAPDPESLVQPAGALPLLSRAGDAAAPPVVVAPDTRLDLGPGDLLAMPNGSRCNLISVESSPVFLRVDGFPVGSAPQTIEGTGITAEQLDLDLGLATARGTAPGSMVVGRLTLAPGATVELGDETRPLLFAVEAGALELAAGTDGSVVRRAGTVGQQPSEVLAADARASLGPGDAAYVPPASGGAVANAGPDPLVLFSVAVVPSAQGAGTPSP